MNPLRKFALLTIVSLLALILFTSLATALSGGQARFVLQSPYTQWEIAEGTTRRIDLGNVLTGTTIELTFAGTALMNTDYWVYKLNGDILTDNVFTSAKANEEIIIEVVADTHHELTETIKINVHEFIGSSGETIVDKQYSYLIPGGLPSLPKPTATKTLWKSPTPTSTATFTRTPYFTRTPTRTVTPAS